MKEFTVWNSGFWGKKIKSRKRKDKIMDNKYAYVIGIDPGVNTGIAIWWIKHQEFIEVGAHQIHRGMKLIQHFSDKNIF